MQVGVFTRVVEVIEQQVPPVTRDEGLHCVSLISGDGDRPRLRKRFRRARVAIPRHCHCREHDEDREPELHFNPLQMETPPVCYPHAEGETETFNNDRLILASLSQA
jgi:hypothetical protein